MARTMGMPGANGMLGGGGLGGMPAPGTTETQTGAAGGDAAPDPFSMFGGSGPMPGAQGNPFEMFQQMMQQQGIGGEAAG